MISRKPSPEIDELHSIGQKEFQCEKSAKNESLFGYTATSDCRGRITSETALCSIEVETPKRKDKQGPEFLRNLLSSSEVAFSNKGMKLITKFHGKQLGPEELCRGLTGLDAHEVLQALRATTQQTSDSELVAGFNLGGESLNRAYRIRRDKEAMSVTWIRETYYDTLPDLMNSASGTCEMWFGINDNGAVIGSHLHEDDLDFDFPSCLSFFPPLENVRITTYLVRIPLADEPQLRRQYHSTAESALAVVCDLDGKAWLLVKEAESDINEIEDTDYEERQFYVITEMHTLEDKHLNLTAWDEVPKNFDKYQLQRPRYAFKVEVTVNPKFAGLYTKNDKELGIDGNGESLSGYAIFLRLRSNLALSTRLELGSRSNFRLRILSESDAKHAMHGSLFDYTLIVHTISSSRNDYDFPDERLGELLFSSTALERFVVVDVRNWQVLRYIIDLDTKLHYSNPQKPRYNVVLLSSIYDAYEPHIWASERRPIQEPRHLQKSRFAQFARAVWGLENDDKVCRVQDVLYNALFNHGLDESEFVVPPTCSAPPAGPTPQQVSSWMFSDNENLRSQRFLPGLVEHGYVVCTEYCHALNRKLVQVVSEFDRTQGRVVQMEVSGESPRCGITTALRISECYIKQHYPDVQCFFVERPGELTQVQELITARKSGRFVVFIDHMSGIVKWDKPLSNSCSVCCVVSRGVGHKFANPHFGQVIKLRWSKTDLIKLADILRRLPFQGCNDACSRGQALDEALKHISDSECQFFFLLQLAAARGRYKPAERWIESQISCARSCDLENQMKTVAFLQLNRSCFAGFDQNLVMDLRQNAELLRFSKLSNLTLIEFVHPELARLYLHYALAVPGFPRAPLFPHPGMIIRLLYEEIRPYLRSLARSWSKQMHDTILALFVSSQGQEDDISLLFEHFLIYCSPSEVGSNLVEFPVDELIKFMRELPATVWKEEDRDNQVSRLVRLQASRDNEWHYENRPFERFEHGVSIANC